MVSTPSGRKKTSAPAGRTDLMGSTPEELVEATRSVTCYAGHYELKDGEVHHHVEMALSPNLIGGTLIRRVHIDGPNLTLSARPDASGPGAADSLAAGVGEVRRIAAIRTALRAK